MHPKHLSITTLLFALPAAAQNAPFHGFLFNWDRPTVAAHLGGAGRWNTTAEADLVRVDFDDYQDWGADANGDVRIRGLAVWIQDGNYATAESFGFVGHAEDPNNAGFPLLTPAFNIPNIPMPPGVNGNTYLVNGTLNNTVSVPGANADVFVGLALPALVTTTPPFDGLFVNTIGRQTAGATVFDEPGPRGQQGAGIFRDDYVCYITGGAAVYGAPSATSLSQIALDVRIDNGGVGGVALAETNQASLTPSNAPLGTSDFLSGLHPDVNGFNAGRADNVGFGVSHHTGQMPVGSPVLVMLAFGPSPIGLLPVDTIPGVDTATSSGNVCHDFTASTGFLALSGPGFLANQAEAQVVLPIPAATRAVIASLPGPLDFWWQGFAIDLSNTSGLLEIRATGCAVQHIK